MIAASRYELRREHIPSTAFERPGATRLRAKIALIYPPGHAKLGSGTWTMGGWPMTRPGLIAVASLAAFAACGPEASPSGPGSEGSTARLDDNGSNTDTATSTWEGRDETTYDGVGSTNGAQEDGIYAAYGGATVEGLAVRVTKLVPSAGYCVGLVVQTKDANLPDPPAHLAGVEAPEGWGLYIANVHGPASECLLDASETWADALVASGEISWPGEWGCTVDVDVTVELPESSDWDTQVELVVSDLEVERQEGLMPCPE
jgi:hypothetical protein